MSDANDENTLVLKNGEKEIASFKRHWHYFFWPTVTSILVSGPIIPVLPQLDLTNADALVTLLLFLFPLVWFTLRVTKYKENFILLTNQRVILSRGNFSTQLVYVDFAEIAEVIALQSFIGKRLGSGNLFIKLADKKGARIFKDLKDVQKVQAMIEQERKKASEE